MQDFIFGLEKTNIAMQIVRKYSKKFIFYTKKYLAK